MSYSGLLGFFPFRGDTDGQSDDMATQCDLAVLAGRPLDNFVESPREAETTETRQPVPIRPRGRQTKPRPTARADAILPKPNSTSSSSSKQPLSPTNPTRAHRIRLERRDKKENYRRNLEFLRSEMDEEDDWRETGEDLACAERRWAELERKAEEQLTTETFFDGDAGENDQARLRRDVEEERSRAGCSDERGEEVDEDEEHERWERDFTERFEKWRREREEEAARQWF